MIEIPLKIYKFLFSFIKPLYPDAFFIGQIVFFALFYIGVFVLCVYIYYRIFVKNTPKKYKIIPIMIPFILFITYRAFEEHGFCWSETRFLSDNELISRAESDMVNNDPSCCMLVEGKAYLYAPTNLDKIFNFVWGGDTIYYEYVSKSVGDHKPYYSIMGGAVNSCGHYNISGYGEEITEQEFNQFRQKAKIKWQNK